MNHGTWAEFIRDLAGELAMDVRVAGGRPGSMMAKMTARDGTGYYVAQDSRGMLTIAPLYPETTYTFRAGEYGRIKVGQHRGAVVCAREIRRRLTPRYAQTLAKVCEWNAAKLGEAQRREQFVVNLLASLGRLARPLAQERGESVIKLVGPGGAGGLVAVRGGATEATIERFRAPAGAVAAMLLAYGEWAHERASGG